MFVQDANPAQGAGFRKNFQISLSLSKDIDGGGIVDRDS